MSYLKYVNNTQRDIHTIILDVEDSSGVFSTYGIFQEGTKTLADRNIR